MQKRLYIIGNGFDLFHGLKTGYWNFKEHLEKNHQELHNNIEKYLFGDDLWSDFEDALERLESDNIVDDCSMYLQDYGAEDWSDSGHHDYQNAVGEIIDSLTSQLKHSFKKWIKTISPLKDNNGVRCSISKDSLFLNFNYTDTLESLYLVEKENILYIHGNIKDEDSKIILGHGREPSTIEQLDAVGDEESDVRTIEANKTINDYFRENYKNTKQILDENRSYFEKLNSVENVVVLGHSMSSVDQEYFHEINRNADLEKVKWIISYYNSSEISGKKTLMESLGVKLENISFLRIDEIDSNQLNLF